MTISDRDVREAIRASVIDPEIGLNIVDLGLVYGVEVDESSILIDMTLTSPGCPAGPQIIYDVKNTVKRKFPEASILPKRTWGASSMRPMWKRRRC